MPADLYDVLGVPDDATAEELKRAYRERVRTYHPDQNDHPEGDAQFKLVKTSHDVLSDPAERKTYDRLGHRDYVEKHLDDLPPVSVFPDEELPDGTSTTDESTGAEASASEATDRSTAETTTQRTTDAGGESSATDTDSSSGYGTPNEGPSATSSSTADRSTTKGRSSTTGTSSARTGSSSETDSATSSTDDGSTTTAGAERSSWDAATKSAQSAASESTVPAGVRRRRGLKRWYGVVALSLLVYLGGLGAYALPRQNALQSFLGDVASSPAETLLASFPLTSPAEYVLDAVQAATAGAPASGLLLLAGTVLLPLIVLTTIGRFGRGAAWLYALPSLAPAVCLAAWSVVALPTWAALFGLVVLPVLSGGGFLVDIGRYLQATR